MPNARFGVDMTSALKELERSGELVRGELLPGGSEREWCDTDVLRRVRRASVAALRKEVEAVDQSELARFLPAWQNVDTHRPAGAGPDRLREALVSLQGLALTPEVWERDVLGRRLGAYSPNWLDQLTTSGEIVWIGAGPLARTGRVALYFREDVRLAGPPPSNAKLERPEGEAHDAIRARLAAAPSFWLDLVAELDHEREELHGALWDLVWVGEVTNDAFAPLRARRLSAVGRSRRPQRRFASRRQGSSEAIVGRWSLTESLFRNAPKHGPRLRAAPLQERPGRRFARRRAGGGAAVQGRWSLVAPLFESSPAAGPRLRAQAELMLERYGIVTRETVLGEGVPGGFSSLYGELSNLEMLGTTRRGYFVEGLGGAQFALPGAVERLRDARAGSEALVLAAADPAQPYGAAVPWPRRSGSRAARVAGAYVVLLGGEAALFVERGGRTIVPLRDPEENWLRDALAALVAHARKTGLKRLAVERFDGRPVGETEAMPLLIEAGFLAGPRRAVLRA